MKTYILLFLCITLMCFSNVVCIVLGLIGVCLTVKYNIKEILRIYKKVLTFIEL